MSRFHERNCCSRWSDSTLHKCTFYHSATSEEEMPILFHSQLSSPLLSLTQQYIPLKETLSEHCLHHKQCSKKNLLSSSYESQNNKKLKFLKYQEAHKVQENLELHLTGIQVEEALLEDKHTALVNHLDLSTVALEALIQYGQSLRTTQLAACRVLDISHQLTLPQPYSVNLDSESTHLIEHFQQIGLQKKNKLIIIQDLIEHCSKYIAFPKYLNEIIHNHCIKKEDFYIATKNFKHFVHNLKLSTLQMEKLQQQYNTILNNYQESRYILGLELPKIINKRLLALQEGFEKIQKFDCNDADPILISFKLLNDKLCPKNSETGKVSHDQQSSEPQVCQKCKTNHISED